MSRNKNFIKKAAAVFASNTLLSRITGLVRDITLSAYFSARETDIWITAFRIPNLLRRLVAENAITVAVVPILSEYREKRSKDSFIRLLDSIFTVFILFMSVLVIVGILLAPILVKLLAPKFSLDIEKFDYTVKLAQIMFPYIALIAITALFMGVLNTLDHFFATAFHPVLFNLTVALGIFIVKGGIKGLVWAGVFVVLGGFFQVIFELLFLRHRRFFPKFTTHLDIDGLKRLIYLLLPAMLSSSVVPLAVVINTVFASSVGDGGVSYLYWSDRIVQLPLGIFAVAISTAILPLFSRNKENTSLIVSSYEHAFKLSMFILIPSFILIFFLAEPIVSLIFERGAFTKTAVINTAIVVKLLSISLIPSAVIRVNTSLYYAFKKPMIPLFSSFIGVLGNLVFAYFLVPHYGLKGLSVAIVLGTILSALFSYLYFNYKIFNLRVGSATFYLKLVVLNISLSIFLIYINKNFELTKFTTIVVLALSLLLFFTMSYLIRIKRNI